MRSRGCGSWEIGLKTSEWLSQRTAGVSIDGIDKLPGCRLVDAVVQCQNPEAGAGSLLLLEIRRDLTSLSIVCMVYPTTRCSECSELGKLYIDTLIASRLPTNHPLELLVIEYGCIFREKYQVWLLNQHFITTSRRHLFHATRPYTAYRPPGMTSPSLSVVLANSPTRSGCPGGTEILVLHVWSFSDLASKHLLESTRACHKHQTLFSPSDYGSRASKTRNPTGWTA